MTDELCKTALLTCESPIEELMRDALLRLPERRLYVRVAVPRPFNGLAALADGIWVIPQATIRNYRIDLLVVHKSHDRPDAVIAIECDGHEWHERTPEQAQRDKSRDRALQSLGMQVLRFTGRELWRDADACATEVVIALDAELIRRWERTADVASHAAA